MANLIPFDALHVFQHEKYGNCQQSLGIDKNNHFEPHKCRMGRLQIMTSPCQTKLSQNLELCRAQKPIAIITNTHSNNIYWFVWRISAPVFSQFCLTYTLFFTRFAMCKNISVNFSLQSMENFAKLQSKGYHRLA